MSLSGKKVIVGICGSIAAYKSAILVRLLVKSGAEVKVVMTSSAKDFITPLTLSTLSKNPVLSDFTNDDQGMWNNHVELGLWADVIIVAPLSAHTLAKMANGICDNLLVAIYLSARCPVFFAPAMDLDMLVHPSVTSNIQKLINFGNHLVNTEFGELASGLIGNGRMAEPEDIIAKLHQHFSVNQRLAGKRALVTAGPTYELLDPVRFIGNHSSGKMGYAIAEELALQGAQVDLISGPTHLTMHHAGVNVIKVVSAEEMFQACSTRFEKADMVILSAAVADYKPANKADQKIKKSTDQMSVELVKTIDIAAELGKAKRNDQFIVGFALETENEIANAEKKISSKNFDLIVLNSLNEKGAGFGYDTNKITIIDRKGKAEKFSLKSKREVAKDIVNAIINAR